MVRSLFAFSTCLLLGVMITFTVAKENCDRYGVLFYEDIGCTAIESKPTDDCPDRYSCDFSKPKSGCVFKARHYGPQEVIPSNLTYSGCSIGCRCQDYDYIQCAVLDCPEQLSPLVPDESSSSSCYHEYALDKCCSVGTICPDGQNVTSRKKCEVDGATYEIGQRFYPKNTCLSCVCHANFTKGVYDRATCRRSNCVTQIRHAEDIHKKCAVAYFNFHSEEALCCPDAFVCPADADSIRTINRDVEPQEDLLCDYGSKKLNLGEGFDRVINRYGKDRNLKCECVMPPLVTCKET